MSDDDPRLDPVLLAAIAEDLLEMVHSAVAQDRTEAREDIPRLIARYEALQRLGQPGHASSDVLDERIAQLRNHLHHA